MATVTLSGNPFNTVGELPAVGSSAPDFNLCKTDLSNLSLADLSGKRVVLNIFPSVDTPTCAASVRQFNEKAASLDNVVVVCISADLPFAMTRFCGAEGIENVISGSVFKSSFGDDYGVEIADGPLVKLLSRAIVVLDTEGKVVYTEQVAETADEPNYDAALASI